MRLTTKQKLIKFGTTHLMPVVRLYWRVFKPITFGVKVIIEHDGKFIFIKNSYTYELWSLVGGGIKRKEKPEEAAIREVKEEVGIDLKEIKFLGTVVSTSEGKRDTVHAFYGKSDTLNIIPDEFEIAKAEWFTRENLPNLGPIAKSIWNLFLPYT